MSIHVIRSGRSWIVQTAEGFFRARFLAHSTAIRAGAAIAAEEGVDLVLHDRNDQILLRVLSSGQKSAEIEATVRRKLGWDGESHITDC